MTDDRTLRTSRTLPFSPEEIYGAFASPELLAAWWGPEGFSNTFEIHEFTEGGALEVRYARPRRNRLPEREQVRST
ncbi:hypothetical protein DZK25_08660 [Wenzhouxiangella sp. 15181]|nr:MULTISPECIES: SRPBCC domain-containing protein [unclassified Wenzhouxiangella]RFF27462.1 hypothetical protein DZK25_08660 [Wenzhouxiangella sp. 15181]RFP68889.1 hypothetical protein DZK26_07105 [Wenzhouxiangella sp. 15190]